MYNELCILHCIAADFSENLKEKETSPGYNILVDQKALSTFYTAHRGGGGGGGGGGGVGE